MATRFRRPFRKSDLVRMVLVSGAAVGAYFSAVSALTAVAREASPDAALRLAPNDPPALADKALMTTLGGADPNTISAAGALAERSLRGEPLNPRPYFVLLAAREMQKRTADVRRLSELSLRLSRRETALQLWHIERSVTENDIPGALRHYDYVLRAHPELNNLLFERLVGALDEPAIRQALVPYAKARTNWVGDMLRFAVTNGGNPVAMSALILESGGLSNFADGATLGRLVLETLIGAGAVDQARDFYLRAPGASRALLQDPALNPASATGMTPIAWELRSSEDTFAAFSKDEGNGRTGITIQMPPERSAVVARKMLFLTPGNYILGVRSKSADPAVPANLTITPQVYCFNRQGQKQVLGTSDISTPSGPSARAIAVGDNCPSQRIELKAVSGVDQGGGLAVIEDVTLRRVR